MTPKRIMVLGGGFAGLWAAAAAARFFDQHEIGARDACITLVNRDRWHALRVRNYEADLSGVQLPLDDVLEPIGVERIEADVVQIDAAKREVQLAPAQGGAQTLGFDRLVIALGSVLARPALPGLAEHAFDVDTTPAALRLQAHLRSLANEPRSEPGREPGRSTVVVVDAGLTGIETAMEMPARLRAVFGEAASPRVVLVDHRSDPGSDLGDRARPILLQALRSQGVEVRCGVSVAAVAPNHVRLADGSTIAARTVVWCAGMRAQPVASQCLPAEALDKMGRLHVDSMLRVEGLPGIYAAGDIANCAIDGVHASVMSCQHARPMGRFAGWNAAASLFGEPELALHVDHYVTVLDLGPWGALYLEGWDRRPVAVGAEAKRIKEVINHIRIVPPRTRDRKAILDAAEPLVQAPPAFGGSEQPYSARLQDRDSPMPELADRPLSAVDAWRRYDDDEQRLSAPVSERMLDLAGLRQGARVLDIATGRGEPALRAGARVAPDGEVVGTDISTDMLDFARARAAAEGITNLRIVVTDGQTLAGIPEQSFDAVLCRWGFMFFDQPLEALKAARRCIKLRGTLVAAVWAAPEQVPWWSMPRNVLARLVSLPPAESRARSPFYYASSEGLLTDLASAGFLLVHEEELATPLMEAATPEGVVDWCLAFGLARTLADCPASVRLAWKQEMLIEAARYRDADGVYRLGGTTRLVVARVNGPSPRR